MPGYVVPLQNTTQQPSLDVLSNRATRQAIFENSWNRTERGGANDTRATIARMAQLRAEKAKLARLPEFRRMEAGRSDGQERPRPCRSFCLRWCRARRPTPSSEAKDIQALIDEQKGGFQLQPWDWNYYSEQIRKKKYDIDETQVEPYFELNNVLQNGVFYAANQLYGLTFKERKDIPVYNPDVRVFRGVRRGRQTAGALVLRLLQARQQRWRRLDGRAGCQGSKLLGTLPVVYNVANFAKPAPGQPALLTFDDVTTMFHEFGHALHGMFGDTEYPSLAGTAVPRDFVEFPSQFNEHWASYPAVFDHYAKNYKTGAPMPAELAAKIRKTKTFNQGYDAHGAAGSGGTRYALAYAAGRARRWRIRIRLRRGAARRRILP